MGNLNLCSQSGGAVFQSTLRLGAEYIQESPFKLKPRVKTFSALSVLPNEAQLLQYKYPPGSCLICYVPLLSSNALTFFQYYFFRSFFHNRLSIVFPFTNKTCPASRLFSSCLILYLLGHYQSRHRSVTLIQFDKLHGSLVGCRLSQLRISSLPRKTILPFKNFELQTVSVLSLQALRYQRVIFR